MRSSYRMNKQGVTIIEMLLVIALVGTLVVLLSPTFSASRSRVHDAQMLSNLRLHANTLTIYSNDFSGYHPFLTDPESTFSVLRCQSKDLAIEVYYLDVVDHWQISLADAYYDGDPFSPIFASWGNSQRVGLKSWIVYPYSFYSDPQYWDLTTRTGLPAQFGPTRQDSVIFPSQKTFLLAQVTQVDRERQGKSYSQPAAFVDGRSEIVSPARFAPRGPAPQGIGEVYTWRPRGFSEAKLFYTLNGVRGRDVK